MVITATSGSSESPTARSSVGSCDANDRTPAHTEAQSSATVNLHTPTLAAYVRSPLRGERFAQRDATGHADRHPRGAHVLADA